MRIFPVDDNLSDRLNELGASYGRLATVRIRQPDPTDQSTQGGFELDTILYICTAFHDGARRSRKNRRRAVNKAAGQAKAVFNVTISRLGGTPNLRAYSRLNCDALS
jgi:hypothetical protein